MECSYQVRVEPLTPACSRPEMRRHRPSSGTEPRCFGSERSGWVRVCAPSRGLGRHRAPNPVRVVGGRRSLCRPMRWSMNPTACSGSSPNVWIRVATPRDICRPIQRPFGPDRHLTIGTWAGGPSNALPVAPPSPCWQPSRGEQAGSLRFFGLAMLQQRSCDGEY